MATGKKTIIFDLDGTLIDSLEDIAVCMNKVLEELNLPVHKIDDYKYFVGSGVDVLVNNALKDSSQEIRKEVLKRFKKEYDQQLHAKTKPYEGIYQLLDELKKLDYNLAVLSNKPHDFTIAYVKHLFKDYNFKEIHGQKEEIPPVDQVEVKNTIIENFIQKEPKISKLKEESDFVFKEKDGNISHLMTETLANLYISQKLYSKAIKAYEILGEKHPEKKEYFLDLIQKTKDLRKNS